MRVRIIFLFALFLAFGTVFCSSSSAPPSLGTCCILTASDGSVDCYCGTASQGGALFSTVVVSGSACTVTFTSDGGVMGDSGAGQQLNGYPPVAISDCPSPIGN